MLVLCLWELSLSLYKHLQTLQYIVYVRNCKSEANSWQIGYGTISPTRRKCRTAVICGGSHDMCGTFVFQ
jgi:hypothetical protein